MRKIFIVCLICLLSFSGFSQKAEKLYSYYQKGDFVKCVQKCDAAINKNPGHLEAYYIKAIAYYEMAQLPSEYKDFSRNPILDCLKSLSILSSKDEDREVVEEHSDTLAIIRSFAKERADKIKMSNRSDAQAIYQRLSSIYKTKTDPLEFARIDAQVGDYEKCMSKISRLYEKAPAEINSTHDSYEALTQGALLLAENWMFRDLFWLIETYKTKFAGDAQISNGFKKALLKSIDTARTDDDKTLFYDFSKKGLALYPNDKQISVHISNRWKEIIDSKTVAYRATASKERTWKDSVLLRDAYKYLAMAREIFPESAEFSSMEKKLNYEFHTAPFVSEIENFRKYALLAVNNWRKKGCECDTGEVFWIAPVPQIEWDTTLERLANEHARDMFFNNHSDDVDSKGENPWDRINKTRYKGTSYEVGKDVHFVQAMDMAFCVAHGNSLNGIYEEKDLQKVIDTTISQMINERLSGKCTKVMKPDVTHMALAIYGDKWVFWAIRQYDIIQRRKK